MVDPNPQLSPRADDLFDDYVARREAGEPADFEALCRAHPDVAPALREHEAARELIERLVPGPLGRGGKLGDGVHAARDVDADASIDVGLAPGGDSDSDADTPSELLERLRKKGERGDRYKTLGEIARGGMGIVLCVKDTELRRRLAMKVALSKGDSPREGTPADSKTIGRFLEEAQITSQLDHPGIVPVHEIGIGEDGRVFFTMRLVRGEDLRTIFAHVRKGVDGWSQMRAVGVILRVCEAMSYAHNKGVIHRDLKPANIMVGRFGEVYVMDWGLARVLGREDRHDLRIRPEPTASASAVDTERHEHRESTPDSPLMTMDGQFLGTPAYMSPEQAKGQIERLGPRTDVYAVGAMLYHLISGEMPYVPADARLSANAVRWRVIEGPPRPLHEFGRTAPVELVAICEKAMARENEQRYPDMRSLANDLRAFLERRVVAAYKTGSWAETRMWIRRNPGFAVSLAVLVLALVVAAVMFRDAAGRRKEAATLFQVTAELGALQRLSNDGDSFLVGSPGRPAHEIWIETVRLLVAQLPDVKKQLADFRSRVALTGEALSEARATYPRAEELAAKRAELLWRDRMLDRQPWPTDAETDAALRGEPVSLDLRNLNSRVFRIVRPDEVRWVGHEVLALRLAQRLVKLAEGTAQWNPSFRDTLAFALFRNGRLDDAVTEQRKALEDPMEVSAELRSDMAGNLRILEAARIDWRNGTEAAVRDVLANDVTAMELEISDLAASLQPDDESAWLEQRAGIVHELTDLKTRLERAERAVADRVWDTAIAAIQKNSHYDSLTITRQLDLLPLREDPVSGLWEFAHLSSGEPAWVGPDGRLILGQHTGLVLVLLPGGYVPVEEDYVPVEEGYAAGPRHEVLIAPFFLSKYEMTEHQWDRLSGMWRGPLWLDPRVRPAANMDWNEAVATLRRATGWLRLPSPAEWEYGCRAGTRTRWWTGNTAEGLRDAAWLLFPGDDNAAAARKEPGRLAANKFGLHDTHGNVAEWCLDHPGDGGLIGEGLPAHDRRLLFGGGYQSSVNGAGSGSHRPVTVRFRGEQSGLRPARYLTR